MKKILLLFCMIIGVLTMANASDFILIQGGTFQMGSPESEDWRSSDEVQHTVSVSPLNSLAFICAICSSFSKSVVTLSPLTTAANPLLFT